MPYTCFFAVFTVYVVKSSIFLLYYALVLCKEKKVISTVLQVLKLATLHNNFLCIRQPIKPVISEYLPGQTGQRTGNTRA